jgi:hypothetical protein
LTALIILKVIAASSLVLAIPATFCITCWFAVRVITILSKPIFRKIDSINKRHYIAAKLNSLSKKIILEFSEPRIVVGQILLAILSGFLFFGYLNETRPLYALFLLVPLGLMPVGMLAILLCGKSITSKILDCPFCTLIRWMVLLILVWLGHAQTADNLSKLFGAASSHIPIAFSAGTFLSVIGLLSIPTAILLLIFQVLLFITVGTLTTKKIDISKPRWITAAATCSITFILLSLWIGAQTAVGTSNIETLIISDIALETDMLDEEVCTGFKSSRRIAYFDADQTRAFVFDGPADSHSIQGRGRPIRHLKKLDIKNMMPIYKGVVDCHYTRAQ